MVKLFNDEDISSSWFSKFIDVLEYKLHISIDQPIEQFSSLRLAKQLQNNQYANTRSILLLYYTGKFLSNFQIDSSNMQRYVTIMKKELENNGKYNHAEPLKVSADDANELVQGLFHSLLDRYIEEEFPNDLKKKGIDLSAELHEELCGALTYQYSIEFEKCYDKLREAINNYI